MNSKTDYEWYFANGYLTYEEDAYGNRISYNYDTAKKTGQGTVLCLNRTGDGSLS